MVKKTITVKVNTFAKKNEISKEVDLFGNEIYKIKTTSKPIDGEANKSVVEILSDYFSVCKSSVKIVKGLTSGVKVVEIE